jgi:hypothetical protein
MSLPAVIRRISRLEVEFYQETPGSISSPRGLSDTSICTVLVEPGPESHLIRIALGDESYYIPRDVLVAMAELAE